MWGTLNIFVIITAFGYVSAASDKKVVCYYGSWSVYRQGNGNFKIEDIDPFLCTHLIYAFVGVDENGSIRVTDYFNDITNGGYKRFNALKYRNPKLKTLVAIGGWKAGSWTFSQVAGSPQLRKVFIHHAIDFIRTHGFDGFDLDWEYPAQRGGSSNDKVNFGLLVKEFRSAFSQHGYLLSAAVGASAISIQLSYDVPTLSQNLDFINVMTYDLHGSWERVTGHNAPLFAASNQLNVAACIHAWIDNGAAPEKLILGIGAYGRSFTLSDPLNNGIGAPIAGPGDEGPYTKEAGMLGYNEICEMHLTGKWIKVWNDKQKIPYAYSGNQWVGYDDPKSVGVKMDFSKKMNLGGAMVWSIETDDFRGICGPKYPILSTINSNL